MRSMVFGMLFALALGLVAIGSAAAKNIDLSTVPNRQKVQLTIYNSEDLTLVRETRTVSFKKGVNPLQFSWANTLIDPTSVELRFVTRQDKLEVLDTTFPHDKPQMLYWNVQSEIDGEAAIEISYFTSGISWSADYVLVANPGETQVNFEGFVRVSNNSGEEYQDAQVRLVVGKINLVEKIAELARVPVSGIDNLAKGLKDQYRLDAAKKLTEEYDRKSGLALDFGQAGGGKPKEIIKEGLSEYFIYTIEGTETILNGWSKRMRSLPPVQAPLKIQYRYREAEYGSQLVRMYLMTNNKEAKLGTTPLPDGVVRVFRDNGHDGLSFLIGQPIKYIPIGDKIELNLGPDPEVIFELIKLRVSRDTLWMLLTGPNLYSRADAPGVKIDIKSTVAGWDDHTIYAQRVRNYSAKPIELEVRRSLPGHIVFRSQLPAKNYDFHTVEYTATVEAGKKQDLLYEIVQHQGYNAKQDNVTLEKAEVKP
ncbi:MAG: hypothetical protein JO112_15690 [Planctomycetes bacterium]|nr:hypothetical protein [Planctomycetota bacterium]